METRYVIFLVAFGFYIAIRHVYESRTRGVEVVERGDTRERLLLVGVFVSSLLLPLLHVFSPLLSFADYPQPTWLTFLGAGVLGVALLVFWRSHADLGENWSVTLELRREHVLITRGVYRRIRHPMYLGIFLFCIGQGLLLQNWIAGWSALAAFAGLYVVRVPREERMMLGAFGEEYRSYLTRTGRVFPSFRSANAPAQLLSEAPSDSAPKDREP